MREQKSSPCPTKGRGSYGKSIPRDVLDSEVGDLIKTLEPAKPLLALVTKMFSDAWDARIAQVRDKTKLAKRQIANADKQRTSLLDRIFDKTNAWVIFPHEKKISKLERAKAGFAEIATNHRPNQGKFEELPEIPLRFTESL